MAAGEVQLALVHAAAEDGIVLGSQSFDWLCEQGHVGLERVAKARRDPALVGPVTAAIEQLGAIYARLQGDISVLHASRATPLLPVDLVHESTGNLIEATTTHSTPRSRSALGFGRNLEAGAAYERAAAMAPTYAERDFLRHGGRASR